MDLNLSGFGFQLPGFGFGFKKIEMDSDLSEIGFEVFGFETSRFAHHWSAWIPNML